MVMRTITRVKLFLWHWLETEFMRCNCGHICMGWEWLRYSQQCLWFLWMWTSWTEFFVCFGCSDLAIFFASFESSRNCDWSWYPVWVHWLLYCGQFFVCHSPASYSHCLAYSVWQASFGTHVQMLVSRSGAWWKSLASFGFLGALLTLFRCIRGSEDWSDTYRQLEAISVF